MPDHYGYEVQIDNHPEKSDEDEYHITGTLYSLQGVRNREQVTEDTVFGHNAALACHMANESYFRKSAVNWDAASNQIKSY